MAAIQLQPLTKETIETMGLVNHDLWMVKIDQDIYGPFDGESLKNYSIENETMFDEALASKVDNHDFRPFWSHALFQRRSPQIVSKHSHKGPFWLLNLGQKEGPYSFQEINKKIEMNALSMSDYISSDNGEEWKKLHEWVEFDRREQTEKDLPNLPSEESFHAAKIELIEKLEHLNQGVSQEELVEMTHQGQQMAKVLTLNLDELTLNNLDRPSVGKAIKWAVPGAAVILVTMISSIYFMFSPAEEILTADSGNQPAQIVKTPNPSSNIRQTPPPKAVVPSPRQPASIGPSAYAPKPSYPQASRYPTHMETHEDNRYDDPREPDPRDLPTEPVVEADGGQVMEHSLVNSGMPEDQSLDAAMNGAQEPVVEEATDF